MSTVLHHALHTCPLGTMNKLIISFVLFVLILISSTIFIYHETSKFPRKFNTALESNNDISSIIEIIGKPNYVDDQTNFHSEITSNIKNRGAFEVYYWSNGNSSYHYVVVDQNRNVINYESEGW